MVDLARPQVAYGPAGFWTAFRVAALADDLDPVVALTAFPFETRGSMDDDPIVKHDEKAFRALWPKLMAADPGVLKGDQRAMIQAAAELPPDADDSGFRVGNFEFAKRGKAWRLVMAYWSADGQ